MTATKKRLIRGRDWHGWAWMTFSDDFEHGELFHFAEPLKPLDKRPTEKGRWVRVKFVLVDERDKKEQAKP